MIIDISQIEDDPLAFEFSLEPAEVDADFPNVRLLGPVLVAGKVGKDLGKIAVEGTVSGEWELDCTRCLQPIKEQFSLAFDVDYVPEGGLGSGGEAELDTSDLDADELENGHVDLKRLAREQLLLNIPEQIFCGEDCKGLCEKCGANRNLIDCKCGQEAVDPRWAALKNLKDS